MEEESPLVKAAFGLGIAGVDGTGDFSLKISRVGWRGCCRVGRYKVLRVWWKTFRNSSGLGKCSLTCLVMITG